MYLKGRNVRYIHLPASLNPGEAIEAQVWDECVCVTEGVDSMLACHVLHSQVWRESPHSWGRPITATWTESHTLTTLRPHHTRIHTPER